MEKLFGRLVDQRLDDAEVDELVQILGRSRGDVDAFRELVRIHFLLAERCGPVPAFSIAELRAVKAIDSRFDKVMEAVSAARTAPSRRRTTMWAWLAVAASIGMAVALWRPWIDVREARMVNAGLGAEDAEAARQWPAESQDERIVARVLRKIDCDWAEDRWSVTANGLIQEGQLITLTRGLLILKFSSGAEVTLNGPATLTALSKSSVKLTRGELTASVPPEARGFRVETHAGRFIDLGTEFGLLVDEDGQVETHVFKGEVVAQVEQGGSESSTLLNTGDAWARLTSGPVNTRLKSQPGKFLLPLKQGSTASGQDAKRLGAAADGLTLHFSADQLVQSDINDGVSEWGDQIDDASNARREDAWQVEAERRPKLVEHSINGRPAIRFDGYRSLVTEPVRLGGNQTAAIVFRADSDIARELIADRSEFQELGVQLLNMNGPPNMVVQISRDLSLTGRVHLGFLPERVDPVDIGFVKSAQPVDNSPHVVVYSFDVEHRKARLFFDGQLVAQSTDVSPIAVTTAPRCIGGHFAREGFGFTGDIAEVLVYDRALPETESIKLSRWLGDKYSLFASPAIEASASLREVRE